MIANETWRPVVECPDLYEVSSLGNVRPLIASKRNPQRKCLMAHDGRRGYLQYRLYINGVQASRYAHRLVAEAFICPRSPGYEVNHIDGDKFNNAAANLEWVTRRQNLLHARRIGLPNRVRKITDEQVMDIRAMRRRGDLLRTIAEKHGIGVSNVCCIAKGRSRTVTTPEVFQ